MNIIRQVSLAILSIALGCTFLYSAWTKLNPVQVFENTLVAHAHFPWLAAAISARLFVGLEFALGALLILHLYGRNKFVIKASIGLLIAFSIYLLYIWAKLGNDVNCGCFGDAIWMTPVQSLIKNALMLVALCLLLRFHKGFTMRWAYIAPLVLIPALTILPLILYSIPEQEPHWLNNEKHKIDLSVIKAPIALDKGKHIIAFFSLTCPHCKIAAEKMHLMKLDNPSLPFFMVLNGDESDLPVFFKKTKATNIPYTMLLGADFVNLSGYSLPKIYWVNNGWAEADVKYISLNQSSIEAWLKKH